MCAGVPGGRVDACNGDSGAGFMCKTPTGWQPAGIISYGYSCGNPNSPGVYIDVAKFHQWIGELKISKVWVKLKFSSRIENSVLQKLENLFS